MRFVLDRRAMDDLREIGTWIAADRPQAARQVLERLRQAFARLAEYPESGRALPALGMEGARVFTVGGFLVVYWVTRPLQILRVLRRGMDVSRAIE